MTPTKTNRLLAAMQPADWLRIEADLDWVELPRDTVLYQAGSVLHHVYFPAGAVVSLVSTMEDGAAIEVAVVGNEGVVGVCAFMGGGPALSSAVVQRAGHAWRMSAASVVHHTQRSADMLRPLLRYTQSLFTHLVQTSACNQHHALEQQMCRWLLLHFDRQAGNELNVTQERIAGMLGVRREGITGAAVKLQKEGLISYCRGSIAITDRRGLELRCCECYAVMRQADERLSIGARTGGMTRTGFDAGPPRAGDVNFDASGGRPPGRLACSAPVSPR
jgi:CRP-like cAMP-binding protein